MSTKVDKNSMKWQELCAHSDALTQNLGKWLESMTRNDKRLTCLALGKLI